MLVRHARDAARQWVHEDAARIPGFRGALFSGSTATLPEGQEFPYTSDLDVKIVLDALPEDNGPQKFPFQDVVIDLSYATPDEVATAETVLGTYYAAAHFLGPAIISDPSGHLAEIQPVVRDHFAERRWVRARSEHACQHAQGTLAMLDASAPLHGQVIALMFPLVFASHMIMVADLKNPTARRCLATMRDVLDKYGLAEIQDRYLHILGSATLDKQAVEALLESCAAEFDTACAVRKTPYVMGSNISPYARPMAIDGAREMIDCGDYREAMIWILLMHTLARMAIVNDGTDGMQASSRDRFERLLDALGMPSAGDVQSRHRQLDAFLPDLWTVTEAILASNVAIVEDTTLA